MDQTYCPAHNELVNKVESHSRKLSILHNDLTQLKVIMLGIMVLLGGNLLWCVYLGHYKR